MGGAYFEVSIASGATRVPGVTPCVAVGVCQRAFKLRGKQPGSVWKSTNALGWTSTPSNRHDHGENVASMAWAPDI